jgi:hypothetical protein
LRFEALVPPGRYTLTMASPEGAWCTSVLLRGRDIADEVFVVGSEDLDLTVICGDATTRVRGTVRKDDGVVDADAAIVAFPVERTSWVGPAWRPRRFQSATTDAAGGFTLVNLPAGEYFVAAIPISRSQLWQDPALLDTLTRAATRVSLTMSESRTVELRTVQIK